LAGRPQSEKKPNGKVLADWVPIHIRERMLASLVNVAAEMPAKIAEGLGMKLPEAMPKALAKPTPSEVTRSPALSLMALPGDGGIRNRKVAILVADGVHGGSVIAIQAALSAAGAVACLVAPRLGPVPSGVGRSFARRNLPHRARTYR
jgi:catalase